MTRRSRGLKDGARGGAAGRGPRRLLVWAHCRLSIQCLADYALLDKCWKGTGRFELLRWTSLSRGWRRQVALKKHRERPRRTGLGDRLLLCGMALCNGLSLETVSGRPVLDLAASTGEVGSPVAGTEKKLRVRCLGRKG